MHRWSLALAALVTCFSFARLPGGEFNPVLNIGDPAPGWSNLPGVDGKQHSLADLHDKDVVVVVFTCNSCEIATAYEDRLIAFAKKYAGPHAKTAVVAINVNTVADDRLPKMKERADSKCFPFPYVFDGTQKTAKAYGAVFTPEFFVLDKDRKIAYMGAFDNQLEPAKVTRNYVGPAVDALLKGEKPTVRETVAHGCLIRFERARRRKPVG